MLIGFKVVGYFNGCSVRIVVGFGDGLVGVGWVSRWRLGLVISHDGDQV